MSERPKISKFSDDALIREFKETRDNLYLEELYGRHIRFVFLVCMKYLKEEERAKDISMQVFEKLTGDLLRFEINHFKSWLHTVTKNTCLMTLRSDRHYNIISMHGKNEVEKNMENIEEVHLNDVDGMDLKIEQLQKAMGCLDDEQKQCIELFYLQEKSYKEVVEMTGFTMNQVKSYIQNGKRNLKNYFVANGNILMMVFMYLYFIR